jgi:hypothetical protein
MAPIRPQDLPNRVAEALRDAPNVESVTLAGSRARSEETPLSDWDFAIATDDFESLARALPRLVEPLDPISHQWDPLSPFPTYMLMLAGPLKVDLLFPDRPNPPPPPWQPRPETLGAIDDHFWDWILWLASKSAAGRDEQVASELAKLQRHLLGPIGSESAPATPREALEAYLARRAELERRFGTRVPRDLEAVVRPAVERALAAG